MVIFVGGSKGGVGKSLVSCLTLHALMSNNQKPLLIETDDSNPDVLKTYGDMCDGHFFELDSEEGWQNAFKFVYDREDKSAPVVINSGARNIASVEKYGAVLNVIPEIVVLWVIDNGKESLNLLADFLKIYEKKIAVVKNGFFARENNFIFFEKSIFSDLPAVYLDKASNGIVTMFQNRVPFSEFSKKMHIIDQVLAGSWIDRSSDAIRTALKGAREIRLDEIKQKIDAEKK